ncbi:holin [Stenotrophomonas sp. PS02298]|uniref:holin n=1 Tax=Stenotrophomonas sp. PS02298 TaxID=2991424 RepID=UPI00249CBA8A|nr:holin [Stenotrophomonas sp. PS02298]
MATETSNNVAPIVAKVSTYGGSAGAVFFGLTANEMAALGGLLIAGVGLLVSLFFQVRNDRRNNQRHKLEMERLQREVDHHV